MFWIIEDLKSGLAELKRWQTWVAIGLIALFGLMAYLVAQFAFRTDSILMFLRLTSGSCRELTNGIIIFLFFGMIFFVFTAVLTLGEFQQFLELKRRAAHHQARQSLIWGLAWGGFSIGIAIAALVFFNSYCR